MSEFGKMDFGLLFPQAIDNLLEFEETIDPLYPTFCAVVESKLLKNKKWDVSFCAQIILQYLCFEESTLELPSHGWWSASPRDCETVYLFESPVFDIQNKNHCYNYYLNSFYFKITGNTYIQCLIFKFNEFKLDDIRPFMTKYMEYNEQWLTQIIYFFFFCI